MNPSSRCPSSADLLELLDGSLPDSDQAVMVSHLDRCSGCQQSLETIANPDSSLTSALMQQAIHKAPDATSAYWPALKSAERALGNQAVAAQSSDQRPEISRPISLAFLKPPADGSHLGSLVNFNIVRVIGRGGMGVVLQAVDTCLQRDVAIKILDPELANDELAAERFCREARAAARISHENVVAVHQVEEDEEKNVPFLVMELITGESLEKKIEREGRLPLREIVRIGMQTAAGLAAAHEKGLIHRDIKPGNILLEGAGQRVKLTDFGLARATEDVRLTRSGLVAGTPLYMSPEQASGEEIDARSDLFSLGVVLYELAAGEPPFNGKTPLVVLKRLTEEQPRSLRELNPDLPDRFVQLVEKLLAKNPKDRFQSAREVADVLEHFWALLKSSEIPSCPKQKKAANIWKAVVFGTAAGLLTLLLGGIAFFTLGPRGAGENKIPTPLHTFKGNGGPLWSMAIAKDGKHLALGADNGTVKLWDVEAEKVDWEIRAHKTPIWALAISPQGDFLATGSDDGITKIWNLATKEEAFALPKVAGVRSLAMDAEGRRVLVGSRDGSATVWDFRSQKELAKTSEDHASLVSAVAFAPDGKSFATASADKTIKIWDADTGKPKLTLSGHESGVYSIAFAPKSSNLVSGSWDRTVRVWSLDSGTQIAKLEGHTQDVWSVAFNSSGTHFASAGEDQIVRIHEIETKKEIRSFRGSTGTILNISFAGPEHIVAAGKDGTAHMWRIAEVGK